MITKQETFNTVVAHARKQGTRATKDIKGAFGGCQYRMSDGRRCFAGVLIPDELYRANFEGWSLRSGVSNEPSHVGKVLADLGYDIDFVNELQKIHDMTSVDMWEEQFQDLAEKHGLEVPDVH